MKAEELRIGNYVLSDRCIFSTKNIYWFPFDYCLVTTKQGNDIHVQYDLIEPITLTEEILLKAGFMDIGNVNFLIAPPTKHIASFKAGINEHFGKFAWNNTVLNEIEIKYVHQLQNLYFALTGSELEIKL